MQQGYIALYVIYAKEYKYVIQDTCTLSSSVNKCITICTPSIYLVVRLANPLTIASVAPPPIEDEQPIISFGDANKDII